METGTRYIIRHKTSGDHFVATAGTGATITAISDALADDDWRDRDNPQHVTDGLDLFDFELEALDEPEADDTYAFDYVQRGYAAPVERL